MPLSAPEPSLKEKELLKEHKDEKYILEREKEREERKKEKKRLTISSSMQSGRVDNRIPLKLLINGLVASKSSSIYSLSIAVKLPPKNAISASLVFSFKESTAIFTAFVTSSAFG